jgi:hypothetical protein
LYSEALQILLVYDGPDGGSEFAFNSPCFGLNAAAHAVKEGKCDVHGRRSVGRGKSGAFVDCIAEDQRLHVVSIILLGTKEGCAFSRTYHFRNLSILKTSSIVRKQRDPISNRAEPRNIRSVPDGTMQAIVIDSLHASKLFFSVEPVAAKLLSQDRKSSGVRRVNLAGSAGLCDDTSNDGIFGVGVAVRVRSVASCGLAPEDHVVWIASGKLVSRGIAMRRKCRYSPEGFDVLA